MSTTTVMMRTLGRSGIQVSAIGLGCWAIGGRGWGEVNDDESVSAFQRALDLRCSGEDTVVESDRAIHRGFDLCVTFYDTADVYGHGRSERVLARALEGKRQQVVIATKFTWSFNEETGEEYGGNTSPDYIRQACEASLRRLKTDYIDLYQFHWNDYPVEKAGEVRDTLDGLVQAGKIRYYGWSTDFVDRARFFAEKEHCTAIQLEMNVIDDAAPMTAFLRNDKLAGINRGPLAMGLLTGKYTANSKLGSDDVRGENAPDWMKYF